MSFVDTNVLVNALNPSAADHRRVRSALDRLRQDGSVSISRQVMREFLAVIKQVHDANIVATMLAHGESRLLTFNGADFGRFAPLIEVVEP